MSQGRFSSQQLLSADYDGLNIYSTGVLVIKWFEGVCSELWLSASVGHMEHRSISSWFGWLKRGESDNAPIHGGNGRFLAWLKRQKKHGIWIVLVTWTLRFDMRARSMIKNDVKWVCEESGTLRCRVDSLIRISRVIFFIFSLVVWHVAHGAVKFV